MAMNLGSGSGDSNVMVEMNTTPLIDVMLVTLIVTIPIQTHGVTKIGFVGNEQYVK